MNTKKIIIILVVIGCLAAAYMYISKSTQSEAAEGIGSLISSNGNENTAESFNDQLASDTAFLSTLVTLKRIKIDTSLFTNELFTILADNAVKIDTVEPGRSNPFASIGIDANIKIPVTEVGKTEEKVLVVTNDATKVTTKTAILNASVNTTEVINSSYFEYGTSELLENKTPQVTKTQAGTYSINITGLQSKTTYYFRATSLIGGAPRSGEVKSFTTN